MSNKLIIEELPITEAFLRHKRLIQERGELALIEDGEPFQHLGYFSLLQGKGYRGGHYHRNKTEHFYVISGKLRVETVDVQTGQEKQFELHAGHKVKIFPLCAHRFFALQDAQVIEYYNGLFEKDDDISFDFKS